jgi:hypothetical protein
VGKRCAFSENDALRCGAPDSVAMISQDQTVDLATYLSAHPLLPPADAAIFVRDLAEQLAALHAEGRAHGPLERGVSVEVGALRARPVIVAPSGVSTPPGDVWRTGHLLARLLDVSIARGELPPRRPDEVPPQLWSLLVACLDRDPGNRPTAAVLAHQLGVAARDPLLGVWPALAAGTPGTMGPATVPDHLPVPDDEYSPQTGRLRLRFVPLAVAAVVLVGAGGATAAKIEGSSGEGSPALPPPVPACAPPDCGATASLHPGGRVIVCDAKKDGYSGVAMYSRSDQPGEQAVWASEGAATCVTHDIHARPGVQLAVKACTGERPSSRMVQCGEPIAGTA